MHSIEQTHVSIDTGLQTYFIQHVSIETLANLFNRAIGVNRYLANLIHWTIRADNTDGRNLLSSNYCTLFRFELWNEIRQCYSSLQYQERPSGFNCFVLFYFVRCSLPFFFFFFRQVLTPTHPRKTKKEKKSCPPGRLLVLKRRTTCQGSFHNSKKPGC